MEDEFASPRVTVQPNFEIVVEAEIYPARLLSILQPLTEPISENAGGITASVTILSLKKERVAAALVQNPNLDVLHLLQELSGKRLPQNVTAEVQEWGGHAELFTLYAGFGLLEELDSFAQAAEEVTVEQVSTGLRLVRDPRQVLSILEEEGLAPLWVEHAQERLSALPPEARTVVVCREAAGSSLEESREVPVLRTALIKLHFPAEGVFEAFRSALLDRRCPIEADPIERTITYAGQYQACVDEAIQALENQYQIRILEG
jgi:hypothetical protein